MSSNLAVTEICYIDWVLRENPTVVVSLKGETNGLLQELAKWPDTDNEWHNIMSTDTLLLTKLFKKGHHRHPLFLKTMFEISGSPMARGYRISARSTDFQQILAKLG